MNEPAAKPSTDVEGRMKAIGRSVQWRTPAGYEFLVLVFPHKGYVARINHVTNSSREDAISALKVFLTQAGAMEGDWTKHI